VVAGGAGGAVNECLAARGIQIPVRHVGLPDRFVEQGERGELLAECGLDAAGVLRQLARWGMVPTPAPMMSE
jgi:1-deoxy-D-xylulose-5-phosphate synthase